MDWKNKPHQIFNKVKLQMFSKGIQNFYYLDEFRSQFDPEHTNKMSLHNFNLFTNKFGVFLTTQQLRNIKDVYGKGTEQISYLDFLQDVKYSIPERVTSLLAQAYDKLDPQGTNKVSLERLNDKFVAEKHPHVLSRRKSPGDVRKEFNDGIGRKARNGVVSREDFVDYFAQLNFCIPNQHEKYLVNLLKDTWQILDPQQYVSPNRMTELQHILYQKVRQKSNGKTNEWKCAKKALSYFDLGDEKACNFEQFVKGLDKFGCVFKRHEMRALFDKYDIDRSGRLDYEEFSKMLMGIDINGMESKPNLLKTLGTNYFKITH